MPYLRVNLSNKAIELLDKLKQEYKLDSRSHTLEVIIEQLLEPKEQSNLIQEVFSGSFHTRHIFVGPVEGHLPGRLHQRILGDPSRLSVANDTFSIHCC